MVFFILAIYLDNVLADKNGVRRRPWYFLLPSYWGISGRLNLRRRPTIATTMCAPCHPSLRRTIAPAQPQSFKVQDVVVHGIFPALQEFFWCREGGVN